MNTPASTTGKLEAVRQKCVEANPEIDKKHFVIVTDTRMICKDCGSEDNWKRGDECDDGWDDGSKVTFCNNCGAHEPDLRPIRLADVLIAVQKAWGADKLKAREFYSAVDSWDLWHDSLDDQSSDTVAFLHSLLVR